VLRLVAEGLSTADIARRLHLTVRNYVSVVLAKLGAEDRAQVIVRALRSPSVALLLGRPTGGHVGPDLAVHPDGWRRRLATAFGGRAVPVRERG